MLYHFWEHITEPLFTLAGPKTIVEIGAAEGRNTRKILEYCSRTGATLHVIDPVPFPDLPAWAEEFGEHLVFHTGLSLDVLPMIERYDAVLIDGDHNWYTVFHELTTIEEYAKRSGTFPLVLLHDTAWPYDRRDTYFSPSEIPMQFRQEFAQKGILPDARHLTETGGYNAHNQNAEMEGGLRNGVLTAVEDFLLGNHTPLTFTHLPGIHGIGILLDRRKLEASPALCDFVASLEYPKPIALHIELLESQRICERMVAKESSVQRARAEGTLAEARAHVADREREIGELQGNIRELRECTGELQKVLARIYRGKSWRWTSPLRWMFSFLRELPRHSPFGGNIAAASTDRRPAAIIIPIFNAFPETQACIDSVLCHTDFNENVLVLIDDCSSDPRILPYLESVRKLCPYAIRLVHHEKNIGFLQSANDGIRMTAKYDAVLLNSDTVVSPEWLSSLQETVASRKNVASVTALSNQASIYSVCSKLFKDAPHPSEVNRVAKLCRERGLVLRPEIPTGVGFCMLLRRVAIEEIGTFDEAFGFGYGEENDWCMRARRRGWRHYLDDRCFVYHRGHASTEAAGILPAGATTIPTNEELLRRKHPEYPKHVQRFLASDASLSTIRAHLERSLSQSKPGRRHRIGFLLHDNPHAEIPGGTEYHVADLLSELRDSHDCVVIFRKDECIHVQRFSGNFSHSSTFPIYGEPTEDEICAALEQVLRIFALDILHVHHALGTSFRVIGLAKRLGVRVIYSIHDCFALSPSPQPLVTWASSGWHYPLRAPEEEQRIAQALSSADCIVAPSSAALREFNSRFGNLQVRRMVIAHGIPGDFPAQLPPAKKPTVCFPGMAFMPQKGDKLVSVVALKLAKKGVRVIFLGSTKQDFPELTERRNMLFLGRYARGDVLRLLQSTSAHVTCILSRFPETFSYVLSESLAAGIPVYVTPIGALAERVQETGAGRIAPSLDPKAIADDIVHFLDSKEYEHARNAACHAKPRSSASMAEDYVALYAELLSGLPILRAPALTHTHH